MNNLHEKFTQQDMDFFSDGTRCSGRLYRPKGLKAPPVVVMAHGFSAEKTFRLPAYAQRFVEEGIAVFVFDYRCIGESDGEPRGLVNLFHQFQDLESAIEFVHRLSGIDNDNIALWGSSFGGGHVIVAAAKNPCISVIICQVSFVDPFSTLKMVGIKHVIRSMRAGLKDVFRMLTFRRPYYIPVVGDPDTFACMNTPDAKNGYMSIVPDQSLWKNECPARILLNLLSYRPLSLAGLVKCPALFVVAENDSLISPRAIRMAAEKMRKATLISMPIFHFDVYTGDVFRRVVEIEAEFLKKHLFHK